MSYEQYELPDGWIWAPLDKACVVNPRHRKGAARDDTQVSFVPMAAVDHESGAITGGGSRPYGQVRKGFTHFSEGDVLFARITPCMENGKIAIARGLANGLGCGTTEFHVLRPLGGILPEYVHRYLRQESFRRAAAANMSGTAGQLRVPTEYIKSVELPLAPLAEQRRIVAKIEALFEQSRTTRQALDCIPPLLKKFRQAVLAAAFRGDLTRDWREQHPYVEPASPLLKRMHAERRRSSEEELGGKGKRAPKASYDEPEPLDVSDLPSLPEGWAWATLEDVATIVTGSTPRKADPRNYGGQLPFVKPGDLDIGRGVDKAEEYLSERGTADARMIPANSVMVTCIGATIGKTGLSSRPLATNQQINSLIMPVTMNPVFVYFYCLSDYFQHRVRTNASSTTLPILNKSRFGKLPLPVAPFDEQQRIVATVETLIDQADTIERAVEAAGQRADTLEQSILARAFRGELVPQNPNDEPASAVLDRIRASQAADSAAKWTGENGPTKRKHGVARRMART